MMPSQDTPRHLRSGRRYGDPTFSQTPTARRARKLKQRATTPSPEPTATGNATASASNKPISRFAANKPLVDPAITKSPSIVPDAIDRVISTPQPAFCASVHSRAVKTRTSVLPTISTPCPAPKSPSYDTSVSSAPLRVTFPASTTASSDRTFGKQTELLPEIPQTIGTSVPASNTASNSSTLGIQTECLVTVPETTGTTVSPLITAPSNRSFGTQTCSPLTFVYHINVDSPPIAETQDLTYVYHTTTDTAPKEPRAFTSHQWRIPPIPLEPFETQFLKKHYLRPPVLPRDIETGASTQDSSNSGPEQASVSGRAAEHQTESIPHAGAKSCPNQPSATCPAVDTQIVSQETDDFIAERKKGGHKFGHKLFSLFQADQLLRSCKCELPQIYRNRKDAEAGKGQHRFYLEPTPNDRLNLHVFMVDDDAHWCHCDATRDLSNQKLVRKRKAEDLDIDLETGDVSGGNAATKSTSSTIRAVDDQTNSEPTRRRSQHGPLIFRTFSGCFQKMKRASNSFTAPFTRLATRFKARVIGPRYETVETRTQDPQTGDLVVKRFKRRYCLPIAAAATAEVDSSINQLPFFEWTNDTTKNIGKDCIEEIRDSFKENIQEIKDRRLCVGDTIDEIVDLHKIDPTQFNLGLSILLQNMMVATHGKVSSYGFVEREPGILRPKISLEEQNKEHNRLRNTRFMEAAGKYQAQAKQVIEFIDGLYLNPKLLPLLKSKFPQVPKRLNLGDLIFKLITKDGGQFLGMVLSMKSVFKLEDKYSLAISKMIVDIDAIHKQEIPPSLAHFPGYTIDVMPGSFPHESIVEDVPVEDFIIEPVYECKHPDSRPPTSSSASSNTSSNSETIRMHRRTNFSMANEVARSKHRDLPKESEALKDPVPRNESKSVIEPTSVIEPKPVIDPQPRKEFKLKDFSPIRLKGILKKTFTDRMDISTPPLYRDSTIHFDSPVAFYSPPKHHPSRPVKPLESVNIETPERPSRSAQLAADRTMMSLQGLIDEEKELIIATRKLEHLEVGRQIRGDLERAYERDLAIAKRKLEDEARIRLEEQTRRIERERLRREEEEKQRLRERQEEERRLATDKIAALTGLRGPSRALIEPLPHEWSERIKNISRAKAEIELAKTPDGTVLTKRDFEEKLLPETAWLNDNIIIGSIQHIGAYVNSKAGVNAKNPKCATFTSYFWPRLLEHGPEKCARLMRLAGVGKDNFFNIDTILIPINSGSHWTIAVVLPKKKVATHMDSLRGGHGTMAVKNKVMEWVKFTLGDKYVEDDWTTVDIDAPLQTNGWDCGVFAITNGLCLAIGVNPNAAYAANQLPLQRRRLAAMLLNLGFKNEFGLEGI